MSIKPVHACNIVTACCVLHNISKSLREPNLDQENDVDVPEDELNPEAMNADVNFDGQAVRAQIIADFFTPPN